MAIPAPYNEHGVLAHHSSMAKPIQRLCTRGVNLLPLELLLFQCALPEIVVPSLTIIASEHIHITIVEHCSVVCSRAWTLFPNTLDPGPCIRVQIKVKQVIKVMTFLPLITPKEV